MSSWILGISAVVGAGTAVYGAYESKKQADKAYDAQQAAFADDVQAAITNAEWKLNDDQVAYNQTQSKNLSDLNNYIDSSWDTFSAKDSYNQSNALLESMTKRELSDVEIQRLKDTTAKDIAKIAEMASLDAEYKIAMASASNDETLTKAAIEATEYADLANSTVQLLDQDIHAIKSTINQIKEVTDIQTKEAIGQEIASTANTVTAGGSMARKMMNNYIKADIMANTKLGEQESALDKALATQSKTARDANTKMTSTINQAQNKVIATTKSTIASVSRDLANSKLSISDKQQSLRIASKSIKDSTNAYINQIGSKADLDSTFLQQSIQNSIKDATAKYDNNKAYEDSVYEETQYRTNRSLEQSIYTQMKTKDKALGKTNLTKFYNENPDYVMEAIKRDEWKGSTELPAEAQISWINKTKASTSSKSNYLNDIKPTTSILNEE